MILEIETRAGDIPDGATVRKIKGTKEYTLRHELTVYYDWNDPLTGRKGRNTLKGPGVVFLQSNTSLNGISEDKTLVWLVDQEQLLEYLKEKNYREYTRDTHDRGLATERLATLWHVKARLMKQRKDYEMYSDSYAENVLSAGLQNAEEVVQLMINKELGY